MTPSLSAAWIAVALSLLLAAPAGQAQPAPRFKAVAFDYFVIFDANRSNIANSLISKAFWSFCLIEAVVKNRKSLANCQYEIY